MAQELANSLSFTGHATPNDASEALATRKYAHRLFGEIAVRIVAFAVDMVAFLFLVTVIDSVFPLSGPGDEVRVASWFTLMTAYFVAGWLSPLRATPVQFLFGLRVLHDAGGALPLRNAVIRAVALVALWGFTLFLLKRYFSADWWIAPVFVGLLLYLPSVMTRRQGVHDLLAQSIVVNRRHVRSIEDERRMQAFLSNRQKSTQKASRPTVIRMLLDAVALGVPLFLMTVALQVSNQKNMAGRVAYAVSETSETRQLAEAWFEATGRWPMTEAELGRPVRHEYPAGGYFQLEEHGIVRIQFEVREELKHGSILLVPAVEAGNTIWKCRVEGEIEASYLPSRCR